MQRVQKILSSRGFCSRRKAEKFIEDGRVKVNGKLITIGDKAELHDKITVDDKEIKNFVNYPRDIKGVEVGISFIEKKKDFIDISFRSLNYVDVSEIAHKFGGGGHPRAAGTKREGNLEEVVERVIDEVKENV